jgi:integrase
MLKAAQGKSPGGPDVDPHDGAVIARGRQQDAGQEIAPVGYAVAVDRYLAGASLGPASRRVYRISLASWAWALVGRQPPRGAERRGSVPPVVPLGMLDREDAGARLAAALADRASWADVRTVNRELSALRSAVGWWQDQQWISRDPTAGLRNLADRAGPAPSLSHSQVADLFRLPVTLREHAFWRVLYDSGAHVEDVLGMDAGRIDLPGNCAPIPLPAAAPGRIRWREGTSQLLAWLLAGRACGPVFLTGRRAPSSAAPADVCPVTGRARMSYRRAAEIFTAATRSLDPAGRGWTRGQLRMADPGKPPSGG